MLQSELMKQRATTPAFKGLVTKSTLVAAAVVMAFSAPMAIVPNAFARDFNAEINAVQRQIDQYQAEASRLSNEAKTLENELAKLASEKATIQASVDLSQTKFDKLRAQIEETKRLIKDNEDAQGETLATLAIEDTISPLEMLASSKNIGDFVDKQANLSTVKDNLQATRDKTIRLKKELEVQQRDVELVLADQTAQRNALTAKEAERQKLMDDTKGQEGAYQTLSAEGRAKKEKLENEQQAAIRAAYAGSGSNAVAGDPNRGGYPNVWANSDYYNPSVDDWGMYARQCVSYTAWKVYQKNGHMPYWGGVGNANQWPGNADRAGITRSSTPRAGSVGVIMAGQYGHVVWVESVNSNGTINISQYNYYGAGGPGWGNYSEMYNVSPGTYDTYIYF